MLILNAAWLGIQLSQKVSFEYSHGNLNMCCLVTLIVPLQNAIFYNQIPLILHSNNSDIPNIYMLGRHSWFCSIQRFEKFPSASTVSFLSWNVRAGKNKSAVS